MQVAGLRYDDSTVDRASLALDDVGCGRRSDRAPHSVALGASATVPIAG